MKKIYKVTWEILRPGGRDPGDAAWEMKECYFETKDGAMTFESELKKSHSLLGFKANLYVNTQEVVLK